MFAFTKLIALYLFINCLILGIQAGWLNSAKKVAKKAANAHKYYEDVKDAFSNNNDRTQKLSSYKRAQKFPEAEQKVREAGFVLERHHISARDKYNLELWRIPGAVDENDTTGQDRRLTWSPVESDSLSDIDNSNEEQESEITNQDENVPSQEDQTTTTNEEVAPPSQKPVVLLWHGMMSSAVTFLNNGPDSLAYQLSRAGYDVWLGNSRGSGMSTTPHDTLHPVNNNKEFWGFTWADIGDYDVPAAIEFILDQTEMEDLTYIGHSMGTTQMFSALTTANERQFLKEHVNLFVALGPVVYMENIEGPLKLLSDHVEEVETAASLLKVRKLGSYDQYGSLIGEKLVNLKSQVQESSTSIENVIMKTIVDFGKDQAVDLLSEFIFSWTESVMATTEHDNLKSSFPHDVPAGFRTTLHFGQMIKAKKFIKYDYGTQWRNIKEYGRATPPEMHPENIKVPMMLVNAYEDTLSTVDDVQELIDTLNPDYLVKTITIDGGHSTFQQAKDMSWFQEEVLPVVYVHNPVAIE